MYELVYLVTGDINFTLENSLAQKSKRIGPSSIQMKKKKKKTIHYGYRCCCEIS